MESGGENKGEQTLVERLEGKGFTCTSKEGRFWIYEKQRTNTDEQGRKRAYTEKIIYDSKQDEILIEHKFYLD